MKACIKKLLTISILIGLISSCQKDNNSPIIESGLYDNGYFVTNEGNFGTGNGSITFISDDGSVVNNVYESTNGVPLGDVVQSMSIIGEYAYIVVNNSDKIVVATKDSMIHITEISINQPRYIKQVSDNKAYITSWGLFGENADNISVLDLSTNTITSQITCGSGPEKITLDNNGLAYINNAGGWGTDSTITVVDIATDSEISSIVVGESPNSVQIDVNNNIWVLCTGSSIWTPDENGVWSATYSKSKLYKISNNSILSTFSFSDGPKQNELVINDDGSKLFYLSSGSVYSMNVNSSILPSNALISENFDALAFNENTIFGTDDQGFLVSGYSKEYSTSGVLVNTYNVGMGPRGFCFN